MKNSQLPSSVTKLSTSLADVKVADLFNCSVSIVIAPDCCGGTEPVEPGKLLEWFRGGERGRSSLKHRITQKEHPNDTYLAAHDDKMQSKAQK